MAITTYPNAPYYDDYDKDKNYLRILFRPGRSVQVRELNQLQSNVQDQIDKFGRHIFKDGDRVLDGYTTYDPSIKSIGIVFANAEANVTAAQLKALEGLEIQDGSNSPANWKGRIQKVVQKTGTTTDYILYYKPTGYDGAPSNNDYVNIATGESSVTIGATTYAVGATIATHLTSVEELKNQGGVFQDAGVFFVKGCFVHTDSASAFYEKTTATPKLTGDAVFDIVDTIVTSGTDGSLLDNANGEPNVNAPGADRYKISLNLSFVPSDTAAGDDQQQVKLLNIKEDKVVQPARTEYSELGKTLAQRTEEESGSYVVNPFKYDVREYLNDAAGNRGRYTAAEIVSNGEAADVTAANTFGNERYVIGVEPGVAYIQGYRVELASKQDVVATKDRPSTLQQITDYNFSANRGQFIEGSLLKQAADGLVEGDIDDFEFIPDNTYQLFESTASTQVIARCRIQAIENTGVQTVSAATPTAAQATKRLYIYDLVFEEAGAGKTLKDCKALVLNNATTSAAAASQLYNNDGFELKEIGDNASRMVYPLGSYDAGSVNTTTAKYITQKRFINLTPTSASKVIISAVGNDTFLSTEPDDYVVLQVGTETEAAAGETYVRDVNISGQHAVLTLATASGVAVQTTNASVTVFAPVQTQIPLGTKTQTTGATVSVTSRLDPGSIFTFDKVDAYEITDVTHAGNDLNVSDFELVTGQTDTHYGFSQAIYKGSASLKSASIVFTFSYYAHSNGSVFSADSYTGMELKDIPKYEDLRLSNCLDFRPSILTATEGSGVKPDSVVTGVTFGYYQPRKDILVLNQLGEAKFIQGVASDTPIAPQVPADSLLLYNIDKPGYLYSLRDLLITPANNRRYAMSDINTLESRIQNLEYYASLSQLESEAAGTQLLDDTGERFKSGIITDSFRGHGVGNVSSPGYRAAIDRENFTARPMYLSDNARWSFVSGSSDQLVGDGLTASLSSPAITTWNGVDIDETTKLFSGKRKNAITLDFIEKTLVDQPYASDHISVNPYDVATWSGNLELSPSSDEWKDINFVPDIVHNEEGDNTALLQQIADNPNILGTEWNEWEAQWTSRKLGSGRWSRFAGLGRDRRTITEPDRFNETTWTSSRTGIQRTFERQLREAIQTSLVTNFNREVIGNEFLNITFIPFIRSRKVYFKGSMLKPNTTFYLYFDEVNITSYATDDEAFVQFGGGLGADGGTDVARYEGQDGSDIISSPITSGITTNSAGDVDGWFVIPNNSTLRFRTGSRQVRLTSNASNNRTLELSAAESTYHAKGLLENRQRTILSTREIVLERTRLQESRNLLVNERVVRRDPVAQTFMIGNEPTGIMLSSVDIFFQAKDPNLPVELSIVSVENGIPTQNTVPFSKVIKPTGNVNVSEADASLATNFMFDTPIYLQPGVEYAIVLLSNSARYRVWHAEVGGTDVGTNNEKINKNVNLGVLLKSQNASTWTPDQNKDLKFKLNRAEFDTTTTKSAVFTGLSPQRGEVTYVDITSGGSGYLTGAPTVTLTGGGATTQATAKAHIGKGGVIDHVEVITNGSGYTSTPTLAVGLPSEISIATAAVNTTGNTITLPSNVAEAVNGQQFRYTSTTAIGNLTSGSTYHAKTVDSGGFEVSHSRIIQLSAAANGTPIVLTSTGNADQTLLPVNSAATLVPEVDVWKASSYLPIIQDMLLPETSVNYTLTPGSNSYTVFPGELVYTPERVSHDSTSSNDPVDTADTLKLTADLTTTDAKVSPIIDLDRLSLVTFDNIINNSSVFEDLRDDGECAARYITKSIKLSSPADRINIYFDAYRPDESTSIEVYAKYNVMSSSDTMDSLGWTKINSVDGRKAPVDNNFTFGEMKFEGTSVDEYTEVAVKILFKSSNKTYVPEIKNLRVIATL